MASRHSRRTRASAVSAGGPAPEQTPLSLTGKKLGSAKPLAPEKFRPAGRPAPAATAAGAADAADAAEEEDLPRVATRWLQADVHPAAAEVSLAEEHGKKSQALLEAASAEGLPDGWVACRAKGGEVYYYCLANDVSQWSHPRAAESTAVKEIAQALRRDGKEKSDQEPQPVGEHSVYDAKSRHVELPTPGTLFSDDAAPCVRREDLLLRTFALHGLLSEAEADSYMKASEAHGFHGSDVAREFPEGVRNNSRLIHFSDALAAALWRRLVPHLVHRDIYLIQPMGFAAEGRWKPVGVNPCFRIGRYNEGEYFAPHRDGMYVNDDGQSSIYSIVLYLNEDFEGGELELPGKVHFKPKAGTAVLFPHDTLHGGQPVLRGAKYVARSELMFKYVEARAPPSIPNFVCDPLFQKMAALYAQIGDLAALGDATKTTETYQEALGIQIAHKGTTSALAAAVSRLPLQGETLARALSFLTPAEVLVSAAVSKSWHTASCAGLVWRDHCRRSWPRSREVLEDTFHQIDPEVKDWLGLYKHLYLMNQALPPVCTVFVTEKLHAEVLNGETMEVLPAVAWHRESGHPWDSSMKHRKGWEIGSRYGGQSWLEEKELNFDMLPEIYRAAFMKVKACPSSHVLLIPALPGVLSKSAQARLVRILRGRFEVPKICIVPAPLCALLSHNMTTGTVVWGCTLGRSLVCCYKDAKQVAVLGPFSFWSGSPDDVAALLRQAAASLGEDAERVLEHVVFSAHGPAPKTKGRYWHHEPADEEPEIVPAWTSVDAVKQSLLATVEEQPSAANPAELHAPILDDKRGGADVLAGAGVLATMPELLSTFEVEPESRPKDAESWEWRLFAEGKWQKLPRYHASVFESAFRNGVKSVRVQTGLWKYLEADLEEFTVILLSGHRHISTKGAPCRLTRFLRGHPSSTPDASMPEKLEGDERDAITEVDEVDEPEALHVRTMAGRVVLSAKKSDVQRIGLFVKELLEELGSRCGASPKQLLLLHDGRGLEETDALQPVLQEAGPAELLLLIREKEPEPSEKKMEDIIPEDWHGEEVDCRELERLLVGRHGF